MLPFDEILTRYVGEFGWYQRWVMFLMCFAEIPVGFHMLSAVFLASSPGHHCTVPGLRTVEQCRPVGDALDMSIPWTENEEGRRTYSRCERYNLPDGSFNMSSADFWQSHTPESLSAGGTISCDRGWEYDCTTFTSTIVTEWDLVCSSNWLKQLTTALYMVGVLFGAVVFGDMADRFGRRPAYLLCLLVQLVFGVATTFSPNLVLFVIFRFFVGAATSGVIIVSAVMAAEFVGPSERVKVGVLRPEFYAVGGMIMAGIAYGIRDWRLLQLAISLPNLLYIPYYWWCPESPRWLLSRDKAKAKEIILSMAKTNGVILPSHVLEEELGEDPVTKFEMFAQHVTGQEETPRNYTILDLLRTPNMRIRTLIIFCIWFINSCVFYGVSLNITDLSGNAHVNFLISCAVEVPAYASLLFLQERFGRKVPVLVYELLTGVGLIITAALPAGSVRVTLAMISKFCITGGAQGVMIYTVELFPTVTRNIGMGSSSMSARIGATISPFLWLLADVWRPAPFLLFGVMTIVAGLLCMLLPETKGEQLPQTLEDGEEFGKGSVRRTWTKTLRLLRLRKTTVA
ncbi:organic cation transporter protein-like isoform X1 [Branchiostoma floridae]|uniref:Organic cation transporter protein-like isoform X1 n=1 Tax=Branchiostoma floridae TaxID=7739 RepID=A0A9J7MZ52_BRAFL|nr:organic cation transporter protein-like isoform X1 [Branchiostoma floridae]